MGDLLVVEGLGRDYGARRALESLSFRLGRGEVLGLLGPNGAGKSTTLRMLAGVSAPSRGRIAIDGVDLAEQPIEARARIGYLPENPPLYKELTVDEQLRFCADLGRLPRTRAKDAMEAAKSACGLERTGKRQIGNLSKGFQQRVGIAQAILPNPPLVILDEPTSGLDPNQIRDIRALIRSLGEGRAVILSTHILAEVRSVCDRVMILDQGRCVFAERMETLDSAQNSVFRISLAAPPAMGELSRIGGVAEAESLGEGVFRLRIDSAVGPESVAEALVTWGLREFSPQREDLERIFTRLTLGDATPSRSGATA